VVWLRRKPLTARTGVFGAYTMMKILLPFAFLAVACEAMAEEDAQCVPERAAMVDTIQAYARFFTTLGPAIRPSTID
jgi:hypothetical protein